MKFDVKPFGKEYRFDRESDIVDLIYTNSGLRVTVIAATSTFTNIYLEIHFSYVRGFRMLDESDLIAYWDDKSFSSNHHIYEVLSGGWSNGEPISDGILSNREFVKPREWFIATKNRCLTVLAGDDEPLTREISNPSLNFYAGKA